MEAKQATAEEIKEHNRKCWNTDCQKTGWIECWHGYKYCLKHWKSDYKYGSCVGLIFALKNSKFGFLKLIKNLFSKTQNAPK